VQGELGTKRGRATRQREHPWERNCLTEKAWENLSLQERCEGGSQKNDKGSPDLIKRKRLPRKVFLQKGEGGSFVEKRDLEL